MTRLILIFGIYLFLSPAFCQVLGSFEIEDGSGKTLKLAPLKKEKTPCQKIQVPIPKECSGTIFQELNSFSKVDGVWNNTIQLDASNDLCSRPTQVVTKPSSRSCNGAIEIPTNISNTSTEFEIKTARCVKLKKEVAAGVDSIEGNFGIKANADGTITIWRNLVESKYRATTGKAVDIGQRLPFLNEASRIESTFKVEANNCIKLEARSTHDQDVIYSFNNSVCEIVRKQMLNWGPDADFQKETSKILSLTREHLKSLKDKSLLWVETQPMPLNSPNSIKGPPRTLTFRFKLGPNFIEDCTLDQCVQIKEARPSAEAIVAGAIIEQCKNSEKINPGARALPGQKDSAPPKSLR